MRVFLPRQSSLAAVCAGLLIGTCISISTACDSSPDKFWQIPNTPTTLFLVQPVAIDSQGNSYWPNWQSHVVEKYDADGTFLAVIGGPGITDGYFRSPVAAAVDHHDNLFILDNRPFVDSLGVESPWGGAIQKFSSTGQHLQTIGRPAPGIGAGAQENLPGTFLSPTDITVGSDGHLLATDGSRRVVIHFDSFGHFIEEFPTAGAGSTGPAIEPVSIASDPGGDVFVVGTTGYLVRYDRAGSAVATFHPVDLGPVAFSSGTVFANVSGSTQEFSPDLTPTCAWATSSLRTAGMGFLVQASAGQVAISVQQPISIHATTWGGLKVASGAPLNRLSP